MEENAAYFYANPASQSSTGSIHSIHSHHPEDGISLDANHAAPNQARRMTDGGDLDVAGNDPSYNHPPPVPQTPYPSYVTPTSHVRPIDPNSNLPRPLSSSELDISSTNMQHGQPHPHPHPHPHYPQAHHHPHNLPLSHHPHLQQQLHHPQHQGEPLALNIDLAQYSQGAQPHTPQESPYHSPIPVSVPVAFHTQHQHAHPHAHIVPSHTGAHPSPSPSSTTSASEPPQSPYEPYHHPQQEHSPVRSIGSSQGSEQSSGIFGAPQYNQAPPPQTPGMIQTQTTPFHHPHPAPHSHYMPQPAYYTPQGPPGTITPNTTPSSGAPSPSPTHSRSGSFAQAHRASHRYNPHPSPPPPLGSSMGGGRNDAYLSDDEDILSPTRSYGGSLSQGAAILENRKEATRRQRIEAEQRRRDELREGYAKLKDVLPITNQKSSKVSLLERAIHHIQNLTKHNEALQARLTSQEGEIARLRGMNEIISLTALPPVTPRAGSGSQGSGTPERHAIEVEEHAQREGSAGMELELGSPVPPPVKEEPVEDPPAVVGVNPHALALGGGKNELGTE